MEIKIRDLIDVNGSKAFVFDEYLVKYLNLKDDSKLEMKIINQKLLFVKVADKAAKEKPKVKKKANKEKTSNNQKKATNHKAPSNYKRGPGIKQLFKDGKLSIGDEIVYFQPVEEGKAEIKNIALHATIELNANGKRNYIRSKDDKKLYSPSSLRRKLIGDFKVEKAKPEWGHTIRYEWRMLKNNKRLSEL
ncbi:MAG: hypothetical protein PHC64_01380 [Candidatus Gastranaerophilales bacterium]|nr:hypothetical protein [Candidatus Gastranaerophilales bacterium]